MRRLLLFRKLTSFLILLLLTMAFAFAQEGISTLKGVIVDASGEPVPGVTIQVKGKAIGTISDPDGNYKLEYSAEEVDILLISAVGFLTQEIPINGQTSIDISLIEDVQNLEEVVVLGFGTQKRKDVTGSVSQINSDEFSGRPNNQMGSLLQGKAAGVQILSSSGKPSQGINIRVRGIGSINSSSEPLYLVDGVPTTDTRSINPADIETISVLKDASATAIYGSQGANGVVLITTKRGASEVPTVTLNAYGGVNQAWNTLPVLNGEQYRDLMTEMGQNTDWSLYTERTDWQNKIFQDGTVQNYQLAVSGKSAGTKYYLSAGWLDQKGSVRSAEMSRTNFKINLDQDVNDWLSAGTSIAYSLYSDVDINDNQSVNQGGVLLGALSTPSLIGVYNTDGSFTSNPLQNWENPLSNTDGLERGFNNEQVIGNVHLDVYFLKDFTFKTKLGFDRSIGIFDSFLDPFRTSFGRALQGRAINSTSKFNYSIFENTLNYQKIVGKHTIEALAGVVLQDYYWQNSNIETRNFSNDGVQTPNGGSELVDASGNKAEKAYTSYIARLNYSFQDKYLFTANFRADGSSAFGPENRWGYFPSFSTGWRISEEPFFDNVSIIDNLKLRAGWGVVGNDQIGNYAWLGLAGSGANYPLGGVALPGTYPASIQNETLKWEETQQTNFGLDVSFFDNRLSMVVDYYIKTSNDLLLAAPLPKSTGFDATNQNVGSVENKGLEVSLTSANTFNELEWVSSFNITFNENMVTDLVGQTILTGSIAGRGESVLIEEGQSLGNFYGYVFGGVDPTTGDAYYLDANGESTFTPSADDRIIIGNALPDFYYGFTNTLSYKGLGLSIFLQGVQGNDILNASRIDTEGMTDPKNQSRAVLNRWRNPGDVTDIPRASWANSDNSRISSRFIEDGSYVRVKAVTLSYQLPSSIVERLSLGSIGVYATGENLFTLTDYSGFDPEVNAFGGSNTVQGVDFGTYPQSRSLILGLNMTF